MNYYYNPLDETCKSKIGAFARGSEVTFHIQCNQGGEGSFSAVACNFVYFKDGELGKDLPMERVEDGFTLTLRFHAVGLYFYHFRLIGAKDEWGNAAICYLGMGNLRRGVLCDSPQSWQVTVFDENYRTPDWIKGGIMYQIFPDRFYKAGNYPIAEDKILRSDWGGTPHYKPNEYGKIINNDFFGGNLNGIRVKLSYLKSLNVTVLYLNPIFEAYSNHRYDTGDYMKIDSLLGTEKDFDALVKAAKDVGIEIILDGVFNHTGADSRYFNKYGKYRDELGAHQSPYSKYADWYRFYGYPDMYESWWGIDVLPAINEHSESFQEFMFSQDGVIKHWLRHGIGGYRLDVADELPDFFLKKLRRAVKSENPNAIVLGEVWEDASNKIAYSERRQYLLGAELDSVMNYPLKNAIINFVRTYDTGLLRETIAMLLDNYPKQTLDCLMNILGTHDTPRILTVFGGKECTSKDKMAVTSLNAEEREKALKKVKMAAFLEFMLPGVPCIYYGDEAGMEGYQDPFCRRCFPWNEINEDLFEFYAKLGELRELRLKNILTDGQYREVFADVHCLVFERKNQFGTIYVYVNNSTSTYSFKIHGVFEECLNGGIYKGNVEIKPFTYGVLIKK